MNDHQQKRPAAGQAGNDGGTFCSSLLCLANLEKLLTQIRRHEGVRTQAYYDTAEPPQLSIGVGHNCQAIPVPGVSRAGDRISEKQVEELLIQDLGHAEKELLKNFPWIGELAEVRRAVMINMAFNMGLPTLKTFRNTLGAVREGRYEDAAQGMLQSKWARQVKGRAVELAAQMESGEWPA